MAQVVESFAMGEPRPANVAELEAELSRLWRSTAEDPETREAVTRACALTLMVFVENEEAGRKVGNLISGVTRQNPCRVIVMIVEPETRPAGLTAWISAHCHLPSAGEKQVCCEQISILARGEGAKYLDNVVVPLIVPELPVCLWWRAAGFSPPGSFAPIVRASERVIVDSARFPDPAADLAGLAEQIQRLGTDLAFSDLNWTRLTPWRDLIAQCFDSPEARSYLERLTEIRIEYEKDSPRVVAHRAQALLLTGWMASRLAWAPIEETGKQAGGARSFSFRAGEALVRVEHLPRHFEGGGAGMCLSIALKAGGTPAASFFLARGPDGRNALARREIPGRAPVERTVRLEVLSEVELVNEEIQLAGRDHVFEDSLAMVARMLAPAG